MCSTLINSSAVIHLCRCQQFPDKSTLGVTWVELSQSSTGKCCRTNTTSILTVQSAKLTNMPILLEQWSNTQTQISNYGRKHHKERNTYTYMCGKYMIYVPYVRTKQIISMLQERERERERECVWECGRGKDGDVTNRDKHASNSFLDYVK